ncbi:hypothetical protein A3G53_03610 [Candidatus Nomurabacteria bacterium RIFCSPLOWO2_12_FULL_44_11]|uniref:Uncharacterized protein n=1 Tax=Candidatus Nomurabacteria bacterium RIFCSPLOWO2_12_FULL_44_11 TaxID=1801796 RepID=A0A1F6Y4H5_9BACT|nr:MAG: hypothetical protein A3G53_03610 [Candidatus Nomurabacteria bacterium RIFCSPLOWO2_12_FULL_44_11]
MNNKLITWAKILGLSFLLGILWYFAGKTFVSIQTVDFASTYRTLGITWYFILFLPFSVLLFHQNKALSIISMLLLVVGLIFVASGIIGYLKISDFKDDGLFGSIFSAPLWAPLFGLLLLGGEMH